MIKALRAERKKALSRIGILTGGFQIPRARLLASRIPSLAGENLRWLAAYGPHTHLERWFDDPQGRGIVLGELRKTVALKGGI